MSTDKQLAPRKRPFYPAPTPSVHDELRKTWKEGQRWQDKMPTDVIWKTIHAEPIWNDAVVYRRHPLDDKNVATASPSTQRTLLQSAQLELNTIELYFDKNWLEEDFPVEKIKLALLELSRLHLELDAAKQPKVLSKEEVTKLAIANGFKLKTQPDGTEGLNPYVFDFAAALIEQHKHNPEL